MVAWRVFRAIIDPTNRTVLQLMTSRYRKLLLVNGACVARLTCVSLCQFKELARCTARFLTFRYFFRQPLFYLHDAVPRSSFSFLHRCTYHRMQLYPPVVVVRFRDYVARNISTFQIGSGTSFLCFAFPASVLRTFFLPLLISRTAQLLLYTYCTCSYSWIRSCAYERHVTTLVPTFDATSRQQSN